MAFAFTWHILHTFIADFHVAWLKLLCNLHNWGKCFVNNRRKIFKKLKKGGWNHITLCFVCFGVCFQFSLCLKSVSKSKKKFFRIFHIPFFANLNVSSFDYLVCCRCLMKTGMWFIIFGKWWHDACIKVYYLVFYKNDKFHKQIKKVYCLVFYKNDKFDKQSKRGISKIGFF